MESYEVVIVGAGPAGLNCARHLAENGKKVLLLEQNAVIGPKICAGGLSVKDLKNFNIPEDLTDRKFDAVNIFTAWQKCLIDTGKAFVYTIDRKKLGQWQLRKLNRENIIVRAGAMVTKIFDDFVVVNEFEKINFKYLVGADGSNSGVRAYLGLKVKEILIAVQYIFPKSKYDEFEFFFDSKLFGLGYAWIFPHKDYVSIGCGCDPRVMPVKKLREGFDIWLKKKQIDVSKGRFEASPINFDFQGYKFGNIYLAGDAAGLASGLTGEGIYQALASGSEIAKMIIDGQYVSETMNNIIKKKNSQNKAFSFLTKTQKILGLEFEILAFLMKNRWFKDKMIKFLL